MDLLSIILNDFNDMFGNINWNDADNVRRQILEIPDMVAKDERYQNAMKNSDEQNARMESERALQQVIFAIMADNMELFKQFQDNPSFKKWLSDLVFNMTYEPQGKKQGTKKTIRYSDYQTLVNCSSPEEIFFETAIDGGGMENASFSYHFSESEVDCQHVGVNKWNIQGQVPRTLKIIYLNPKTLIGAFEKSLL